MILKPRLKRRTCVLALQVVIRAPVAEASQQGPDISKGGGKVG